MRIERDVLGRSLCIAMKNTVDLRSILSSTFFLTLWTIFAAKIPKRRTHTSLNTIKGDEAIDLTKIDVEIIDGFYLLNRLHESSSKYGQFNIFLLRQICDTCAREIHVMFEKQKTPTVKDVHVAIRKELYGESSKYKINGPNQGTWRTCCIADKILGRMQREGSIKFEFETSFHLKLLIHDERGCRNEASVTDLRKQSYRNWNKNHVANSKDSIE